MLQELMRAVVLLAIYADGELGADEQRELRALRTILGRASRAAEGRPLEELEATAGGRPQPEDT